MIQKSNFERFPFQFSFSIIESDLKKVLNTGQMISSSPSPVKLIFDQVLN